MRESEWSCCYCGRKEDATLDARGVRRVELQPFGPDGAPVCFPCAMATPARKAQAEAGFCAELARARSVTGAAVLSPTGRPIPYVGRLE